MERNSVPLALPIYRDSGQTQLCNPGTVTAPWSRKGHLQAQCSVQPFLPTSWLRSAEPTCCWFTKKEETLFQGSQLLSLHIPLNMPTLWWESPPWYSHRHLKLSQMKLFIFLQCFLLCPSRFLSQKPESHPLKRCERKRILEESGEGDSS